MAAKPPEGQDRYLACRQAGMFGQRGKVFDCIEHKRRVQKKVLEDYEARKDEFASYAGFISRGASACAARPNGRRVGRDQGVAGEDCGGQEGGETLNADMSARLRVWGHGARGNRSRCGRNPSIGLPGSQSAGSLLPT